MKRVFNKIAICMLILVMTMGVLLIGNTDNNAKRMSYASYTKVNPDALNEKVFVKLEKVYNLAVEFLKTNSGSTPDQLTMQYIRLDKYNNMYWNALLDPMSMLNPSAPNINKNFSNYVKEKDPSLTFGDADDLIDETSHRKIDFVHLIVALLTYTKYDVIGPTTYMGQSFDTNYAGWAGDLVTVLEEIVIYRSSHPSATDAEIRNQINKLIATNGPSTMDGADTLADLDAINIYNKIKSGTAFMTALRSYYKDNSGSGNNSANRLETVRKSIGGNESALELYTKNLLSLESGKLGGMMNNSNNASSVNAADVNVIADEFAAYVFGKAHVEISETSGSTKVGTKIKLNILEKNASETAIYKYDKNVVKVVVRNSIMYLEPVNMGTTKVEVYNGNTLLDTYTITVTNVAPSVKQDLNIDYNLVQGLKNTIGFYANGTNNVYTWYISDTEDGEYKVLDTTDKPSLKFIPTIDMNGKYIKCGIKNNGHTEVFTKVNKIKVVDKGVVNTSDTSLFVAGAIVVLVIIANLVFEIKRKKVKA